MSNYYVYQRLEDLVHELNPAIVQPYALSDAKITTIIEEIKREKQRVQSALRDLFYNNNENESTVQLIRKSHHSLVVLINKAYETRHHELSLTMNVRKPLDDLLHSLDQLLHWFHQNFNGYLTNEQPYPITKLKVIRNQILERMESIKGILKNAGNHDEAIQVVTHALQKFVNKIDSGAAITKHEAEYHKDLLNDIERTNGHSSVVSNCPSLHELLVYWNLNSKESISYFTKGLEQIISGYTTVLEKLDYLRLQYKYVNQMPELPNFKYDTRYPSIKEYFCEYLLREIEHLSHKAAGFQPLENKQSEMESLESKVICNLSVDQLSLILRALFELNVLTAKSLSELFKILVRYLATPNTDNISWENMCRRSYAGENRDKQISIETLRRLAEKIEAY